MIGLLVFLGIAVVYVGLGLLIDARNGTPAHGEPHMYYGQCSTGGGWAGGDVGGGFGGGFGGDCGGF